MHEVDSANGTAQPAKPVPLVLACFRITVWSVSALFVVFVTACYWWRFDACTVVTLFPPWCWAAAGLYLTWLASSRRHWIATGSLALFWLVFLVTCADSPASLIRGLLPQPSRDGTLRVVSLNCASSTAAAQEIIPLDPDIVLVQESPTDAALEALADDLYGPGAHLVLGVDASIVARGDVTVVEVPAEFRENFVHARVEMDGQTINVISLRLYPCPVRLDLWSPDCWRSYQWNRETRRRQLSKIARYVQTLPTDIPLIVGGDFNCPPGDAVLRPFKPRLADAFPIAGRGWGATIIEIFGWPLIRIDQIWTSGELRATNAFAETAHFSDHEMAVAEFAP